MGLHGEEKKREKPRRGRVCEGAKKPDGRWGWTEEMGRSRSGEEQVRDGNGGGETMG